MTSTAKVGSMKNSTQNLAAAPQDKCSSSSSTTTYTTLFLFCAKHFKSASVLWSHINSVYISRQKFPAVSYLSLHNCLICSSLACHWGMGCCLSNLFCYMVGLHYLSVAKCYKTQWQWPISSLKD